MIRAKHPPRVGIMSFGELCNHLWSQPEICSRGCTEQEHQPRTLEVLHGGYPVEQHFMLPRLLGKELCHKIRMANGCSKDFESLHPRLQSLVSSPNNSLRVFGNCCQLVHPSGSPSALVPHFPFSMVDADVEQAPFHDFVDVRNTFCFAKDIDVIKEGKQTFSLHQMVLDCRQCPMLTQTEK